MRTLLTTDRADLPTEWRRLTFGVGVVVFVLVTSSRWVPGSDAASALVPQAVPGAGYVFDLLVVLVRAALGIGAAALVWWGARHVWAPASVALVPVLAVLLLGSPMPFATFAVLGGLAVVAAWQRPRSSVLVAALGAVLAWWWVSTTGSMTAPFGSEVELAYTEPGLVGVLYSIAFAALLAAGLGARFVIERELDRRRLAARSDEVEEREVVVTERARLAHDLHDVVAHHVSLIAVRAETAPYTHPDLGAPAREVLGDIAADARLALDELRGVLGILSRSDTGTRSPQPGWADVEALVERSRGAGAEVLLDGDLTAPVAASVGYVVYRVVQEALTNARRHAPGAPVAVSLVARPGTVAVTVRNRVAAPRVAGGPGRGLAGMRERVESLGGQLSVGSRGEDFVVEATFGSRQ